MVCVSVSYNGVARLTYLIGQLTIVWSVAHNFVPEGTGGPFMRERAYQVLSLSLPRTSLDPIFS